jgi:hypothetical protein
VNSLTRSPVRSSITDGDPDEHPAVGLRGAQQFRGGGIVEGPGQGVVLAGQVAGEHRHRGGGFVPSPFGDADEEHPQGAEACAIVAVVSRGLFWPGRAASQRLKSSTWPRVMALSVAACGQVSARNAANERSARSAPLTLPGRSTHAICSR